MAIVASGQLTIVDSNDAKPITAHLTSNPGNQQTYAKDESTVSYLPDWTTANSNVGNIITAKVFVGAAGGATNVTSTLTNRRWSLDLATAITGTAAAISSNAALNAVFGSGTYTAVTTGATATLTIKANILPSAAPTVLYFEADYTDPATGLVSPVVASIVLSSVKVGTNAVYLSTHGKDKIKQAHGATKSVAYVAADLIRAAGYDTTGVSYRWWSNNGATNIYNGGGNVTKFGLKTTTAGGSVTGSTSDIGVNLPALNAFSAYNTLVIDESAVTSLDIFRVEAMDADGTTYQTYFQVIDTSDPYLVRINSSTGDKLQNGVGSTSLTPKVYNGSTAITDLTGWTFTWTFFDFDGNRGAFIDTTRTALAGGRDITVNTAGTSSVITYSGSAITFAAGDIIKTTTASGTVAFYEVASGAGNTVTIRTPVTNTFLSYTTYPAPTGSSLVGGKLFVCRGSGGQQTTSAGAAITLTGDEVDVKSMIVVDANRP